MFCFHLTHAICQSQRILLRLFSRREEARYVWLSVILVRLSGNIFILYSIHKTDAKSAKIYKRSSLSPKRKTTMMFMNSYCIFSKSNTSEIHFAGAVKQLSFYPLSAAASVIICFFFLSVSLWKHWYCLFLCCYSDLRLYGSYCGWCSASAFAISCDVASTKDSSAFTIQLDILFICTTNTYPFWWRVFSFP